MALAFCATYFPLHFFPWFLFFSSKYPKNLSNLSINTSSILCSLITVVHRILNETKFYLLPNTVIPVDWGSGWLWICHISLLPFSSWLLLNRSLLCCMLPSLLLAVPFFFVLASNDNCCIILFLVIRKWHQLMNDVALGMYIAHSGIWKPPCNTCQAFLTLAVEKPTQTHANFISWSESAHFE